MIMMVAGILIFSGCINYYHHHEVDFCISLTDSCDYNKDCTAHDVHDSHDHSCPDDACPLHINPYITSCTEHTTLCYHCTHCLCDICSPLVYTDFEENVQPFHIYAATLPLNYVILSDNHRGPPVV